MEWVRVINRRPLPEILRPPVDFKPLVRVLDPDKKDLAYKKKRNAKNKMAKEVVLLKVVLMENEDGSGGFRRDVYPELVGKGSLAELVLYEMVAGIDDVFRKLQQHIGGELKPTERIDE